MTMGLKALTRELHADERPQLLTHLLALDEEDRRLRFAHALSDDGVRHYVESIDLSRDAVLTAVRVQAGPRRRWHVYGLAASPAGWGAEPASGVSSRYLIS